MKVLLTGGAGYIGAATAASFERHGHEPIILDDLSSGPREFVGERAFSQQSLGDYAAVNALLDAHRDIEAVVHFGAKILVPESVAQPLSYYGTNVGDSLRLLEVTRQRGLPIVFSSTASLYKPTEEREVREGDPLEAHSPYTFSKLAVERVLSDLAAANHQSSVILRYFNPVGADIEARVGMYRREPSHVLDNILLASSGERGHFNLTGTDFDTPDGTGVRDYVHVMDVAEAHVGAAALAVRFGKGDRARSEVVNIGTGRGVSVRELVGLVRRISGENFSVVETERRDGDSAGAYANVDKARSLLGWSAERSLESAIRSAMEWSRVRPEVLGY